VGKALEIEDIPQPEPGPDQVLVRVHAASINPFDDALKAGYLSFMASTPLTLGTDFSGEVVSAGSNITHVKSGDAVYGASPAGGGTFAEYITVKAHEVTRKPLSVDFHCSAGVPLPANAAWIILFDQVEFKPGDRLLVHGAEGNVGGLVVQMAKNKGAYIYGTDIPEKAEHVMALGLDEFIPAHNGRFEDIVQDVDAVIDLVGGELMERSYNILKPGKRYATSLLGETPQEEPQKRGIISRGLAAFPRLDIMSSMADLIDAGTVKVFMNKVFPLGQVNEALEYRRQSRSPGKVIISML
jgi:NADPH:quinone reductase-like Zn-dependent oxidoreductase